MNFSTLDFLYRNSPSAYRDLLLFMLNEFEIAEENFRSSVETKDINAFIQLKHKLLSTLTTLGYSELMRLLEDVCKNLSRSDKNGFETELELMNSHFRLLKSSFARKLKDLKEEQVM